MIRIPSLAPITTVLSSATPPFGNRSGLLPPKSCFWGSVACSSANQLHSGARSCGLSRIFFSKRWGWPLRRHFKTLKHGMDCGVADSHESCKVAEVKHGSVTLSIFKSQNSVRVTKKPAEGNEPQFEVKVYASFVIPFYEGSVRRTPRRSTLEKALKFADETAKRLAKDGARAEWLSGKDRRIYTLAKAAATKLGMEVDELCRNYVLGQ